MMIPNFNSINPSIKWIPDGRNQSQPSIFITIVKKARRNPILILPHSIIITTALVLLTANLFYNSNKRELEPYHNKYTELVSELNTLKASNEMLGKQYAPAYEFIVDSLHPFVFAKELQQLIPRDVQLRSYVLSKTTVSLEASSLMQRSLDDFIIFFASHPLLKPETLNILEITSSVSNSSTSVQNFEDSNESYTQQPRQLYSVKLTAEYQKPEEEMLLQLLIKTGDIGLLEKLRAFKP